MIEVSYPLTSPRSQRATKREEVSGRERERERRTEREVEN